MDVFGDQVAQSLSCVRHIRLRGNIRRSGRRSDHLLFQSGRPPVQKPREPYGATLEVLDVIRGKRPDRERVGVTFGGGAFTHTYAFGPTTPRQLAQEYYVAMYEDTFGLHLVGIPMSSEQYREWQHEIAVFEHERQRSPPK
jgi:hypothetical protein